MCKAIWRSCVSRFLSPVSRSVCRLPSADARLLRFCEGPARAFSRSYITATSVCGERAASSPQIAERSILCRPVHYCPANWTRINQFARHARRLIEAGRINRTVRAYRVHRPLRRATLYLFTRRAPVRPSAIFTERQKRPSPSYTSVYFLLRTHARTFNEFSSLPSRRTE